MRERPEESVSTRWTREEMDVAAKWGARRESEDRSQRHLSTGAMESERCAQDGRGRKRDVGHSRQQGRRRRREDESLSWVIRRGDCG